ncbi:MULTISPECIES: PaaI family thioesterase [Halorussus]|uniref:PaaI family thioesterase n=1 Tax=Halorussus TaxID=1070314 RepID=UPI0020A1F4CF|nr:PaaI family thioesterase [Halorussus vallis]USZ77878.1 PaaI family thioesterase [Halorussus vallis]
MSAEVDREMEEYFESMPFLRNIGIENAVVEDGTAEFHVPYDEKITNHTVVHGGVMATLVDATVAGAIHSDAEAPLDEMEPLTIDMDVNYHAPVTEGDIVARANLVKRGGTIAVGEAEVTNEGDLVASGTATYFQKWR